VRMPDGDLAADLKAIGADYGPGAIERARTLFASVLDCPGGGLRIDTIHAFAQWLLSAFPEEAGLTPGTRAMEDRERSLLAREVLAEMLVDAQEQGDEETLNALADLSLKKGPDAVEAWLMTCAQAREAWFGAGAWVPPFGDRLNQLLGLPADASEADIAALCADDRFDTVSLRMCMTAQAGWKAKTGQDTASAIGQWLAASPHERVERLSDLQSALFTQKGEPRSLKQMLGIDPAYPDYIARVGERITEVAQFKALLGLAKWLLPALTLGRKFALAWEDAKNREGLIDFDDQIRRASDLLNRSELADWIRYKLDRRFDHILVDEAQDIGVQQLRFLAAIAGNRANALFFAGDLGHRRLDRGVGRRLHEAEEAVGLFADHALSLGRVDHGLAVGRLGDRRLGEGEGGQNGGAYVEEIGLLHLSVSSPVRRGWGSSG